MNSPFFSIIVPIYKTPLDYLDICINSILRQTYSDFEVILIDDGSPDESGSVCDKYAERDLRVKVIHQKNQGVSVARNNGLQVAKGKWIMFVDADDWIDKDACKKIEGYLKENETDILVFRAFKENRGIKTVVKHDMEYKKIYHTENYAEKLLLYRKGMQPPNISRKPIVTATSYYIWDKVYKREVLINNNIYFPEGITNSEDKIFYLNCIQKIKTIQYIDEILYHYRIISTSATRRYSEMIDVNRKKCCVLLKEIAENMDKQLSVMSGNSIHIIESDFKLFAYMISSSILLRKFYHEEYPFSGKERKKRAVAALNEEPFYSAINETKYRDLALKESVRKWLLVHRCYFLFAIICRVKKQ